MPIIPAMATGPGTSLDSKSSTSLMCLLVPVVTEWLEEYVVFSCAEPGLAQRARDLPLPGGADLPRPLIEGDQQLVELVDM